MTRRDFGTLVLVTGRVADEVLWDELSAMPESTRGGVTVARIGDCLAPSSIADAVYSAHKFARQLDGNSALPLRERRWLRRTGAGHRQDAIAVPGGKLAMERSSARRRPGRPQREIGGIQQRPWKQLTRPYPPIEILSADHIRAIHETALTVLEEIGVRVLEPAARAHYRAAGADVDEAENAGALRPRSGDGAHRHRAAVLRAARPQPAEERQGRRAALHTVVGRRPGLCHGQ